MGSTTMAWFLISLTTLWSGIATGVSLPTCQAAAPTQNNLTAVRTAYTSLLAGAPFDVLYADGKHSAVVGYIDGSSAAGSSVIEVASDGTFLFVSNEYGSAETKDQGTVEVFQLTESVNGTISGEATGYIALDTAVVGTAFSPDRTLLYATSEESSNGTICTIYGGSVNFTLTSGTISVLNVTQLETSPDQALKSQADASYGAVRVIVSPDNKYVWITSRESNRLLAYDVKKLSSDTSNALVASVQIGTSPIDLTFARNYSLIITADSNRFEYTNTTIATAGLYVVDVGAALEGRPVMIGSIPTGYLPRAFATSPDGRTILVALFNSQKVQAIDASTLPFASTRYKSRRSEDCKALGRAHS